MQILDCLRDLPDSDSRLPFVQSLALFEIIEESAFLHVLQQKIQMLTIVKHSIKFDHILVAAETLYAYLKCQLLSHEVRSDHLFADALHREHEVTLLVDHLEYCPEFALSQVSHYFEVRQFDRLSRAFGHSEGFERAYF